MTSRVKLHETWDLPPHTLPPAPWDCPESRSPALCAGIPRDGPESWSATLMSCLQPVRSGCQAPPLHCARGGAETLADVTRSSSQEPCTPIALQEPWWKPCGAAAGPAPAVRAAIL